MSAEETSRKRSKSIALGLLLTAGVSLASCSAEEEGSYEEEEEYHASSHSGLYGGHHSSIYYNRLGSPYLLHQDSTMSPLPSDHPAYAKAVQEGRDIASGAKTPTGSLTLRRSGFGSSASAHLSSSSSS